jgi:V8-like Glu-specific endopeptidase
MYAQTTGITFAPGRRGYADSPKDVNGPVRTADGFYAGTNTNGYDYALIILKDEARTANLGYMGLTWSGSDSWYEGRSIALAGYPGGNCAKSPIFPGGPCAEYMYTSQCSIDSAGTALEFECDAHKGESGGPLYINGSQILGTLRGEVSDPFDSYNVGVRLTGSKVNTLCSWILNFPSAYASPHWCAWSAVN